MDWLTVAGIIAVLGTIWAIWEPAMRIWKSWWDAVEAKAKAKKAIVELRSAEQSFEAENQKLETDKKRRARESRIDNYIRMFEEDDKKKMAELHEKGVKFSNLGYISEPAAEPGEDPEEVQEAWERFCNRKARR